MATVQLREIARGRAGDKGDISIVAVFARSAPAYEWLQANLTAETLRAAYGSLVLGAITRYEVPQLGALNFVLERALSGGVTRSTRLDRHGKSLASLLLAVEVEVPQSLLASHQTPKGTLCSS